MIAGADVSRITVVSLIDHLVPFGGAELLAAGIAKRLDPVRFESVACATRTVDCGVRAELERSGVRVLDLGRTGRARLDQWLPLIKFLRDKNVAVLHAHKFGSNAWASVLRGVVRTPVVIAHEHVGSVEDAFRQFVDRHIIARSVDVTLTVSKHTRDQMIAVERLPEERIRVFTHGIVSTVPRQALTRASLGLSEDDFVVCTVCVLRPEKTIEHLIDAVGKIGGGVSGLRLLVVGDGPERTRLEELTDRYRLRSIVHFLGHRPDVRELLPIADVCVNSSRFEGSPLAVMEYMAAGRAIVATAVGGVPEILEYGACGVLVPPGEPDRLAAAISDLAASSPLRSKLGSRALERQRLYYDLDRNVRSLEQLYEELVRVACQHPT